MKTFILKFFFSEEDPRMTQKDLSGSKLLLGLKQYTLFHKANFKNKPSIKKSYKKRKTSISPKTLNLAPFF